MSRMLLLITALLVALGSKLAVAGKWHSAEIKKVYPNSQEDFVLQFNNEHPVGGSHATFNVCTCIPV